MGAGGCSSDQGASIAQPPPGAAADSTPDSQAKGKIKSAIRKPSVNVSPGL